MAIREDILKLLKTFEGTLGWNSFKELYSGTVRPKMEIPIYLTEVGMPSRQPNVSEVSTIETLDPGSQTKTTTNVIFMGAPTTLQTTLAGFTLTPVVNRQWVPVDANGNPLNYGQLSYNDIISYYLEGRFNRNIAGAWQRQDPDYYITPYGQYYNNPHVSVWTPSATPVMRAQSFDMTLFLES